MAKYGVVRTDRLLGITNHAGIVSVKYYVDTTATAIENGNVVKVGALMTGEREVYKATAPAANTPITEIALIADPEVIYDERKKALYEFINEAGDIVRGYRLHTGDIFSVTAEALATSLSAIEIGNVVELQAGTKLKVTSSLTANSTQVGTIIDINVVGPYTYYAIQVK